jgi:hemolysin activation/secretion protein
VLAPGKEAGTTDVIADVTDKLPVHIGYELDNFGSRYMDYLRHTLTVEDNNLFGQYDKFSFKFQKSDRLYYDLTSIAYNLPIDDRLDVGIYWLWSTTRLGKEYQYLDAKGCANIGGVFLNFNIIDIGSVVLKIMAGFDYKNIDNYTGDRKTSRDQGRVLKAGFNLDMYDRWGRTIITLEEDVGVLGVRALQEGSPGYKTGRRVPVRQAERQPLQAPADAFQFHHIMEEPVPGDEL